MESWLRLLSEAAFPVNDLLRRKLQTTLITASLTLCVASTLFLLLFSQKLGFGISLIAEEKLTASFAVIFSRFIMFTEILVFAVGAVIISFMVFVMMSHRVRDIGLMKGAGCPNSMIFGYFMTELLIIAFVGCFLGMILGMVANLFSNSLFSALGQVSTAPLDFWLVILVFALFFALTLIFGAKPVLDATKVEPAKALCPTFYAGVVRESSFKPLSKLALTFNIAGRSLIRRKSATFRVVTSLILIFILTTVTIAGGVIADHTTKSWVEKAVGQNIILIAHHEICSQYAHLLSNFYDKKESMQINYTQEKYQITDEIFNKLNSLNISNIDARIILEQQVQELPGYLFDPEKGGAYSVGDGHIGNALIIGVHPENVLNNWLIDGKLLQGSNSWEAMIGDTLAQRMFTAPLNQSIMLSNSVFSIVGICLDPINNGKVVYLPIESLKIATGISKPNMLLAKFDSSEAFDAIREAVRSVNSEFEALELNKVLDKSLDFLSYVWSTVMFLPLFSLATASICLVSYVILAIAEQRQEFGILRAVGARPASVIKIVSIQSLLILLSSFGAGTSLGIISTLMILIPEPAVSAFTILEITSLLLTALAVMFILSLYPAIKFAKKPILETMAQT